MRQRFSWDSFSLELIQSIVYSANTPHEMRPSFKTNDKASLIPYIDRICPYPDKYFIKRYRQELTEFFFAGKAPLVSLITALEKLNYRNVKTGGMDDMLRDFNRLKLFPIVISLIRQELLRQSKVIQIDEDISIFNVPRTLNLSATVVNELPLFDHQQLAVNHLQEHFINQDKSSGVLVMPTGSGKTRVATRFLLQDMVARGWQVVWLAHRAQLIEQAADAIFSAAPIIRLTDPKRDDFTIVCVSGSHATIRATHKVDDVLVFSVQTLVRNLPFLHACLRDKVLIIVDEAHHTLAPSYRLIIDEIKRLSGNVKLLGLTATPVRMQEEDTKRLMKLFDEKIIYSVSMSELIAKGFLSKPVYDPVETNVDFNTTLTLDERAYIRKWGELSPDLLERIARMTERNTLIVDTFMRDKEKYGKTLMFALNVQHCISLCEALIDQHVKCDYVHHGLPAGEILKRIDRFKNGDLDVLVNINILTEGSDVPKIQSVFLTRPTGSDVLLMQMIGRGMRGKVCGGTEKVYLVDFNDIWGSFANWMNPEFLLGNQDTVIPIPEPQKPGKKSHWVEWAMFRDLLDGIQTVCLGGLPAISVLPSGWYDIIDEDGNDQKVLVFESQLSGYQDMWEKRNPLLGDPEYTPARALSDFFGGFGLMPSHKDLDLLLQHCRTTNAIPSFFSFDQRQDIDATYIAQRLIDENTGLKDIDDRIESEYLQHEELIGSVYGSYDQFNRRIHDFLHHPNGIVPIGMKIEELPEEFLYLDCEPIYDLDELTKEVMMEMFHGTYGEMAPIAWTNRPYSTYFGQYQYADNGEISQDSIRINCLLNSRDVPREAVKYIIYHELLHRDHRSHDAAFRALEHKYPDWTELERFLDYTFSKFDLRYAY